ncbi:hypothetical protein NEF87_002133 [Candidatus Lokiarchaeum ossiferum]|uniref:Major facilitator superfamily (MFS) profile domain-containing protein n=1 Tax=Candidatus Lokiarchaeum ossiferum TaxID=2951803 RepID=A0ABY6HQR4_9ARCH|nr:hypothetical protein NEF87_002133 [Candidatus Lokiarchaeum sp. B-35]
MNSTENVSIESTLESKLGRYWLFWSGQKISLLGSEIVQFALTWVLTVIYKDPIILSISMFLIFIPRLIFGPLSGVIADKYDYKKMIVLFDGLQAVATFLLIILIQVGLENLGLYLGFIFIRSTFQTLHGPIVTALSRATIPKSMVNRYQGVNQLFSNIIMMMAPLLGALLLSFADIQQALWVDIITFSIAFGLLIISPLKKNVNNKISSDFSEEEKKKGIIKQFSEGTSILKEIPGLTEIIAISIVSNFLLSPFNTLLPYLINVVHNGTEFDMAAISITMEAAMISGSIIMALKKKWKRKSLIMVGTTILLFIGIAVIALAPKGDIVFLSVVSFLALFFIPIKSTILVTILQKSIPVEKMGRVYALLNMLMSVATPLGFILSGPLADLIGAVNLLVGSSILGIISALVIGYCGKISKIDSLK